MFTVDIMSRTPIYEQLTEEVERFISLGILKAGDPLPSVRKLSAALAVNPNTIQKAYSELYGRGIIASVPGRGNFVSGKASDILREKACARMGELEGLLAELKAAGIPEEEALCAVKKVYEPDSAASGRVVSAPTDYDSEES